ncbi:PEPxxWA-CTERM sorting domain-containing protein [Acinetobacter baumannii]
MTAVPEPATWALMIAGFAAMIGLTRVRRQKERLQAAA